MIYVFRTTTCELCKETFPNQVIEGGRKIDIFEIEKPAEGHYLILEVLGMPTGRSFQMIRLPLGKILNVGRGHESDVRVADISVSRSHANLKYDKATE